MWMSIQKKSVGLTINRLVSFQSFHWSHDCTIPIRFDKHWSHDCARPIRFIKFLTQFLWRFGFIGWINVRFSFSFLFIFNLFYKLFWQYSVEFNDFAKPQLPHQWPYLTLFDRYCTILTVCENFYFFFQRDENIILRRQQKRFPFPDHVTRIILIGFQNSMEISMDPLQVNSFY